MERAPASGKELLPGLLLFLKIEANLSKEIERIRLKPRIEGGSIGRQINPLKYNNHNS